MSTKSEPSSSTRDMSPEDAGTSTLGDAHHDHDHSGDLLDLSGSTAEKSRKITDE